MEAKQNYEVVNGFWDKGQFRAKSSIPLPMTEREAAAHVRAGDLKLISKALRKTVETSAAAAPTVATADAPSASKKAK
ncbi:MAG: hypothetical protein WBP38_09715 [Hyphomicrobium sp.]|nr:hypothetical protein [Hyphomicrobium sp.]